MIVDWLKADFDLGPGHAMALVHVIKNGEKIDAKQVGTGTAHSDASDTLWLDGKQNRSLEQGPLGRRYLLFSMVSCVRPVPAPHSGAGAAAVDVRT